MIAEETGESSRKGLPLLKVSTIEGRNEWENIRTFRGPWGCLLDFLRFPCEANGISHIRPEPRKETIMERDVPCSWFYGRGLSSE